MRTESGNTEQNRHFSEYFFHRIQIYIIQRGFQPSYIRGPAKFWWKCSLSERVGIQISDFTTLAYVNGWMLNVIEFTVPIKHCQIILE